MVKEKSPPVLTRLVLPLVIRASATVAEGYVKLLPCDNCDGEIVKARVASVVRKASEIGIKHCSYRAFLNSLVTL